MQVRDLMTDNPACCTPDASLQDIARLMAQYDCGAIPICDDLQNRRLAGIVTDRDLAMRSLAQGKDPMQTRARDVMTTHVFTLRPDAPVEECFDLMEQQKVRRVVVCDDQNRVVGIVAIADLARKAPEAHLEAELAEALEEISEPLGAPRV